MYCRRCWYPLGEISTRECPECGRAFDPEDPGTWRRRSRGQWWLATVGRPVAIALLLVGLIAALWTGFAYHRDRADKRLLAQLAASNLQYESAPLAPSWLAPWLRRTGAGAPETIVTVFFTTDAARDEDLARLTGLRNLRHLYVDGARITDEGIAHLSKLRRLETLWLSGTSVTPAGIKTLSKARPGLKIYGP
ncbi:MAG: hypothetical protein CMJ18_15675 [Phycisphaeraceae bacterium]|nr:hypothetical protein [Phycisphaeraceae bacterium]